MRADRLVSLVLLLRQRGQLSASELAEELEVSTRTVLRDIESLSAAGVPVYAERGRHGGFSLLPGFRTELTGLNYEEALALLVAGSRPGAQAFGLGTALASAMLKVTDALPASHQEIVTGVVDRFLIDPSEDLLARPIRINEDLDTDVVEQTRSAVLHGHKLRIHYQAEGRAPIWRTVDPIGLVTVQDLGYLLAVRDGEDRTYRLPRILDVEELAEPAERPEQVDLDQLWQERSAQFRHGGDQQVTVALRMNPTRRADLEATALTLSVGDLEPQGWLQLEAVFQDDRHAEWALWKLDTSAEILNPAWLRTRLHNRAAAICSLYAEKSSP